MGCFCRCACEYSDSRVPADNWRHNDEHLLSCHMQLLIPGGAVVLLEPWCCILSRTRTATRESLRLYQPSVFNCHKGTLRADMFCANILTYGRLKQVNKYNSTHEFRAIQHYSPQEHIANVDFPSGRAMPCHPRRLVRPVLRRHHVRAFPFVNTFLKIISKKIFVIFLFTNVFGLC